MGRSANLFDVQDFLGANVIYSEGQPVDYMSKLGFASIFVGLSLGMYILSLGATVLAKRGRDQRNALPVAIMIFLITIFALFLELIVQVITTRLTLHW